MNIALIHGQVLTEDGFRDDLAVCLAEGRIAGLLPSSAPELASMRQHDLRGQWLLPGFIDTQVNGGGGVLFNDAPNVETLRTMAAAHRRFGTAALLPTLISDRLEVMEQAIDAVEQAIAAGVPGIVGIHLEGPYLAPQRKGVHDAGLFRLPDDAELARIARLRNGKTVVTLAPERAGAERIGKLVDAGAIVCAGHTAANYAEVRMALDAGIRGFTHLFNAMSPFTSRQPGVVGAALEDANSWCGLIVDGHHVHPASMRVAHAAKARGKLMLVTDAMPPVGADNPSFRLRGETITARDGRCATKDGTLAGSALDMASAVRNAVAMLGIPLAEAARMASTWPAEFLGIDRQYGHVRPGWQADFTVLDGQLRCRETWVDGTRYPAA